MLKIKMLFFNPTLWKIQNRVKRVDNLSNSILFLYGNDY